LRVGLEACHSGTSFASVYAGRADRSRPGQAGVRLSATTPGRGRRQLAGVRGSRTDDQCHASARPSDSFLIGCPSNRHPAGQAGPPVVSLSRVADDRPTDRPTRAAAGVGDDSPIHHALYSDRRRAGLGGELVSRQQRPRCCGLRRPGRACLTCCEHVTNSVIGVSRPPVLDCGTNFHLDYGGRGLTFDSFTQSL